jgi:hypothetical protein
MTSILRPVVALRRCGGHGAKAASAYRVRSASLCDGDRKLSAWEASARIQALTLVAGHQGKHEREDEREFHDDENVAAAGYSHAFG